MNNIIQQQVYSHLRLFNEMSELRDRNKKKDIEEVTFSCVDGRRSKVENSVSATTKTCRNCNQIFPATLEYFHRNRQNVGGLHSYCKVCRAGYQKYKKSR